MAPISSLACHFGRSELAQQAPQIPFVAQFRINSACGFYSFTYEQSGHSRSDGFEKVRAFSVLHLKVVFSGFLLEGRV